MSDHTSEEQRLLSGGYRARFLFIMFWVCLFDFADRTVFNVTQDSIKAEFGLTDFEIGILGGAAFAALYSVVGVPIGRLAERVSRVRIIAVCTALWSVSTVISGTAGNYLALALGRVGVGLGEAGFMGPVSSLVSDLFPSRKRASRMALIILGTPTGVFLGANVGGWAAQAHDWRLAFILLGAPGLIVAACVLLFLREPSRGLVDNLPKSPSPPPNFGAFLRHVAATPALRYVILAGGISGFGVTSISTFLAPFLARSHDLPPGVAGSLFGTITAIALGTGFIVGSFGTDWLSNKDRRWSAWGACIGVLCAPFLYWAGLTSDNLTAASILFTLAGASLMSFYGPTIGMIQNLSHPRMRATAASLFTMLYALCGYFLGPPLIGFLSDVFAQQSFALGDFAAMCPGGVAPDGASADLVAACGASLAGGLQRALMVAVCAFFIAATCFFLASRTIRRDIYLDEGAPTATPGVQQAGPKNV